MACSSSIRVKLFISQSLIEKSFESVKKSNLGAGRKTRNDILNVFCLIFFFRAAFRRALENMVITS